MPWESWFTLVVLAGTLVVLVRQSVPPSVAILSATVVLMVAGVIGPEEAFSGFSNPAPITVAALYVLARAVEQSGLLQPTVSRALGAAGTPRWVLLRLLFPTAAASAFLNNTPIVAMLVPQVTVWARRRGMSPSKLLLPISYAAILGGLVTAIGTSTNLVVSGLLEEAGQAPLGMFELSLVGVPLAIVGVALLVVTTPWLLPDRKSLAKPGEEEAREFVVNMQVVSGGPLDGVTVAAAGLRDLEGVYLVEIDRPGEPVAPVPPTTLLRGGDRLVFVGRADLIVDLQNTRGLVSSEQTHMADLGGREHVFFEAVIGPASPLVGKTLKQVEFRSEFQAAVVAIHRAGQRIRAKLGAVPLRVGDTLVVVSDTGFRTRFRDKNQFLLVAPMDAVSPVSTRHAGLVAAVALGIVVAAAVGLLPILHLSLLGAMLLVGAGVLTPGEARASLDLDVILVIAGAFGLGAAMQESGLAGLVGDLLVRTFAPLGAGGVLLGVVLATMVLKNVISNNATAVLMFPIAAATASEMGLELRAFAIAIAVASSASFLTPIGYQTNLMVYGPGGYRFGDYARLGAPLAVLVVLLAVVLIPLGWSLN